MIISIEQLREMSKANGRNYYEVVGTTVDNGREYAVINDCYSQETHHVECDEDTAREAINGYV